MNLIDVLSDLTRDRWYRSELIRALRSSPGAASLYFSAFSGSLCLMLSLAFVKEMETASMAVFLVMLILSWSFIIFDLWLYLRYHGLELLRRAGWRCERRMRRLDVESNKCPATTRKAGRSSLASHRQTQEIPSNYEAALAGMNSAP